MSGAARAGPARLAALALLTCSLWPTRADNASQEYYTALINVTVQEPGRGTPLTFRIDRGRYGLDSPKAEVRGQVLAPLPIHGGEAERGAEGAGAAWPGVCARFGRQLRESRSPRCGAWPAPRWGERLQKACCISPLKLKKITITIKLNKDLERTPHFHLGSLFTRGHWNASLQGQLRQRRWCRGAELLHGGRDA